MDINDPIISEKQPLFCEKHNAAAYAFLRDATKVVKIAGVSDPRELLADVHKSLVLFLWTREGCEDCGEV